jgi:hypothetical protein
MFTLESLKLDFSNPMLWGGLVLMVVAIVGYFWMSSKNEEPMQQQYQPSVSFAPTAEVMQYQPEPEQHQQAFEDQPTVATCMINDAGEQVCG